MKVIETEIEGVRVLEPSVWEDERGYFFESFSQRRFEAEVGKVVFVQDNESKSVYGVVRGLHYQLPPYTQAKLVKVVRGKVLDVVVDIRKNSPAFGRHLAIELSESNKRQLFVPKGFAHGFAVLSEEVIFQYKCDEYYVPESEAGIRFDDPCLQIDWEIPREKMILSAKDLSLRAWQETSGLDI